MDELLLTIDEEHRLRLEWELLNPDTRISWRDYWLTGQIAKVKKHYEAMIVIQNISHSKQIKDCLQALKEVSNG